MKLLVLLVLLLQVPVRDPELLPPEIPDVDLILKLETEAVDIANNIRVLREPTKWSSDGKTIIASLVSAQSGKVTLKKDGKEYRFPVSQLDKAGQSAVKKFRQLTSRQTKFTTEHKWDPNTVQVLAHFIRENRDLKRRVIEIEQQLSNLRKKVSPAPPLDSSGSQKLVNEKSNGLRMTVEASPIYLAKDEPKIALISSFFRVTYDDEWPTGGMFQINGKAERLTFKSSDGNVVRLDFNDTGVDGYVHFLSAGDSEIKAAAGDQDATIKIQVIELPFKLGESSQTVVQHFGFPDSKQRHYVDWPDAESIDNIFYKPSAAEGAILVEHWRFNKHPGLVISVSDDRLYRVGSK